MRFNLKVRKGRQGWGVKKRRTNKPNKEPSPGKQPSFMVREEPHAEKLEGYKVLMR